jgi:hypothetical protein
MTALATSADRHQRQVGRTLEAITNDLRVYVKKANETIVGGERNAKQVLHDAEMAAREFRYKAGVCLIEAKASPEMTDFPSYAEQETGVDPRTYQTWMKGGRLLLDGATKGRKNGGPAELPSGNELRGDVRSSAGYQRRPADYYERPYISDVDATLNKVNVERLREKELDEYREEAEILKLAKQIIDIGYKALATKLHPDKGGNRASMARLTEAKKLLLKAI